MTFHKFFSLISISLTLGFTAVAAEDAASVHDLPLVFKNQDGKDIKFSQFKGQKIALTMIYTSCPHACPRILQRMKSLQKNSGDLAKRAKFVIVTIDPARDTTKKLKETQQGSTEMKDWVFLNGSEASIRQLSMVIGIRFEKNPEDGSFSHDNKIVILDENGKMQKEFNGLSAEADDHL